MTDGIARDESEGVGAHDRPGGGGLPQRGRGLLLRGAAAVHMGTNTDRRDRQAQAQILSGKLTLSAGRVGKTLDSAQFLRADARTSAHRVTGTLAQRKPDNPELRSRPHTPPTHPPPSPPLPFRNFPKSGTGLLCSLLHPTPHPRRHPSHSCSEP